MCFLYLVLVLVSFSHSLLFPIPHLYLNFYLPIFYLLLRHNLYCTSFLPIKTSSAQQNLSDCLSFTDTPNSTYIYEREQVTHVFIGLCCCIVQYIIFSSSIPYPEIFIISIFSSPMDKNSLVHINHIFVSPSSRLISSHILGVEKQ